MSIGRREFIKIAAVTAGAAGAGSASAATPHAEGTDGPGVLVDTTLCVGCRACEAACAEKNELPTPPESDDVMLQRRDTAPQVFTVVNRAEKDDGTVRFAKKQCMHCLAPGCASACPVRAMDKSPEGPVVYDPSKCMGCRYCMVACPFDVPKYEYDSWKPRVRKCSFCADRQAKGLKPACTEVCPSGALTFGRRSELLELAKTRIYTNPGKYVPHVYGEHEAGGTSWLYITDLDLEKLAFRADVPEKDIPSHVSGALSAPPFVMTLWPPLLMGLYVFSRRKNGAEGEEHGKEDHHG
ncbi:4Fe-4S dicluster domain-containing protein [Anaeromyxobacter sp. Fw109-5]|uniref:4Fe-4S dicluster domain-containing protein n=1 Tax=Anaeromyxobacter sp. (strain Fw109-5) TaxID=404589 RepID=UPI0000ED8242|nr:4Fe-4S dicluster domain-containing protein [Anaeromyxobacter sp. Fw109-5]ABS26003.1 4Fe-4S ferredoxin iron-sulfur binding domain protein [Anaeromyxobacter sp. Fw109-5]